MEGTSQLRYHAAAFDARIRKGLPVIPPREDLPFAENFFWMVFGRVPHPDVVKAYETVVAACKKHGKWAGMGGVYTDEGLTKYIGMGIKMILAGNDMPFLMQAATAREKHLRGLK